MAIPPLLRELSRRHVFRVAIAYGAVGWIVIQVSTALLPALRLPDWSVTLVAALAILGFPVSVVLAWAFDITPAGVRRTPALPQAGARRAAEEADLPETGGVATGAIAALPFVDRSPGGGHQYLGDGITEELINALARVSGLRVVSRTSAFALRNMDSDVREIGARLGVGGVVEGSVRVDGDRLRITVQLVDVVDGYAVWSGSFDRRLEDLFSVQEEIARSIVAALESRLLARAQRDARPHGDAPLLQHSTTDVGAYTLYLRGRMYWNERTPESLRLAIRYLERAIAADPDFAHAYAGLADCYAILLEYGVLSPAEGLGPARTAAEHALRLGPELAESHTSAALVRQMEWDWTAAERELHTAVSLNPGYATARHRLALLHAWAGRVEEARREIEAARLLDPLSPAIAVSVGWIEYYGGDAEAASRAARETLAEHPRFDAARILLGLALLRAGRQSEAVAELERAAARADETGLAASVLAYALARAGDVAAAERRLEALRGRARAGHVSAYHLAVPLVALADPAAAVAELERAADERSPQLVYLAADPIFEPLRRHAGFGALLERIGLRPHRRCSRG